MNAVSPSLPVLWRISRIILTRGVVPLKLDPASGPRSLHPRHSRNVISSRPTYHYPPGSSLGQNPGHISVGMRNMVLLPECARCCLRPMLPSCSREVFTWARASSCHPRILHSNARWPAVTAPVSGLTFLSLITITSEFDKVLAQLMQVYHISCYYNPGSNSPTPFPCRGRSSVFGRTLPAV